jgi:small neutral amino acid transporter SnatA (MarC family)
MREELTPEQKKAITALYGPFRTKLILATFLYFGFAFLANFAIIIIDAMYIHSGQFRFLMGIGTAFIAMTGLRGTIEEHRSVLQEKVKKIVGHL